MKCPQCGFELPEGNLICENCGHEIQIVPDFEPDVEVSLHDPSVIWDNNVDPISRPKSSADPKEQNIDGGSGDEEDDPFADSKDDFVLSTKTQIILIASVILLILIGALTFIRYNNNQLSTLLLKAENARSTEDYNKAFQYLNKAKQNYPNEVQVDLMMAECYLESGDSRSAITLFDQMLQNQDMLSYEILETIYSDYIQYLDQSKQYKRIVELIGSCSNPAIAEKYQNYLAIVPSYNYVGGGYETPILLKLSANTSGKIYFTIDGTIPKENGNLYTSPILLDSGHYVVNTLFVNDYGIKSEYGSQTYVIRSNVPDAPQVTLDNGTYTEPCMVEVEAEENCQIYYTTNNTTPTIDSVPYTGPIPMPLGTTNFRFIAISPAGVCSDLTQRTYTLSLPGAISTREAVTTLVRHLVDIGYIKDFQGHREGLGGYYNYQFSSVLRIGEQDDYYIIYEYLMGGETPAKTDTVYLVDIHGQRTAKLGYDSLGAFIAIPF